MKALLFLSLTTLTLTLMAACSQSETRVPFYHYGGNVSGGSLGIHSFRSGETLWSVANAYRVDLREMLDLNRLSAPYKMKAGQRIKIPAPLHYKVRSGDTIYKVSRVFDTTTTELVRLNNLKKPYVLKAGQNLRLPSKYHQKPLLKTAAYHPVPQQKITPVDREELPSNIVPPQKNEPDYAPPKTGKIHFIKPVSGQIISGFGPKADGLHNDGINIRAAKSDAVRAAETGVVVYSGQQIEGYGNMLLIRHKDGYLTAYAHMDKILIQNGDKVKKGQTIGTVGSTGNVKTPQLHFEIRKGRDAIDPRLMLGV